MRTPLPSFPPAYRRRFVEAGLWLDRTLYDYFRETVGRFPDRVALVAGERRITFGEWDAEAERVAAGLVRCGIGHRDVVTVQLPNWPEMCVLQVALARIGAIIQPMHMVYRQREMASMLRFCESRAVVTAQTYKGFDHAAAVAALRGELPALELAITVRGTGGDVTYEDISRSPDGLAAYEREHPVVADDVFYLNFTSGTEGDPKGFLHTHNTILSALKRMADMRRKADPTADEDVALANSPMTHSFGHLATYHVVLRGTRLVLVEHFDPGETLRIIERERVSALSGTPTHLISLLRHPDFPRTDVSSIQGVSVGGAQCPPQLLQDIEKVFRIRTGNMYGMGENIVHTSTLPNDPPEIIRNTVGRPVPGAELKIFADDRATERPSGEVGEIAFRGPTLFLGYYKNDALTRATRNAEGWFFTGDLGFVDAAGYLHLAGRKKDLINRGGTKIFPKEIEDLLHAHPKIVRAAIVGMPDDRLGERLCAYVEVAPGETLELAEVCAHLEGLGIMRQKFPERLEIIDALPLTPTGKVVKGPLIAAITEKLGRQAKGMTP